MRALRIESALKLSIEDIDQQHQELVDLVNKTQAIIDDGVHPVMLIQALDRFNELSIRHFSTEEELMTDSAYPLYEEHKQQHDRLFEKTFSFDAKSLLDDAQAGKELVSLMREWLLGHIEADRELAEHLKVAV